MLLSFCEGSTGRGVYGSLKIPDTALDLIEHRCGDENKSMAIDQLG